MSRAASSLGIAAPARRSVLVLIWANILAIAVVGTALIVVAGSGCCRSDRRRSDRRASPTRIISSRIARASRYRTTRVTWATRDGATRPARPSRDRVARTRTTRRKVTSATAMNAPGTMEATTSAPETAAAPGESVVGNQCRAKQHDCCEKYQGIPHDIPPRDLVPILSIGTRLASRDASSTRMSKHHTRNSGTLERSGLR